MELIQIETQNWCFNCSHVPIKYLIIILCTICSRVNEFSICRYPINKLLNAKKYRVSVSVSAIMVSSIGDTQNKVSVSVSVSVIMVSSHLYCQPITALILVYNE